MSEILHVASRKGLFRYARRGKAWTPRPPAFLGTPVTAVLPDRRDGAVYAALKHGHFGLKLHRSDDSGARWKELPSPAFPKDFGGPEKPPSVDVIWTLAAGGADEPGVVWAGTLPGALFRLEEKGERAVLIESLWNAPERKDWFGGGYEQPGIHTVLVDPRDSRRLTIAVSCGGVWKSEDGGADWKIAGQGLRAEYMPPARTHDPVIQDPHRLARSPAAPDIVWCQHHNGIFRSTDNGVTFTEITAVKPSAFGFAVVAHPRLGDLAWFVPAVKDECRVPVDGKLVVNRTTDGGRTFDALGEGLPQSESYDLIYRHALDVDADGERLAMGSTTGNLWTSDDGGRRWTHLAGHLPPIVQVAFG